MRHTITDESRRGQVIVCGLLVRMVKTELELVQVTRRLTIEKTSGQRVVICAYNESSAYILEMFSVSRTSLGVAMAKCRERMSTDQATLAFISSSEKPQPAGKSCSLKMKIR